jgi:hypothetical protein
MLLAQRKLFLLSQVSCSLIIQFSSVIIRPHILATFTAIAMGKQFYRNLYLGSMYNEFPMRECSAFGSDGWKGLRFVKLRV